jgi:hypothetical protein
VRENRMLRLTRRGLETGLLRYCASPRPYPSCHQRPAPTEKVGVICPGLEEDMRAKSEPKLCGKSLHSALSDKPLGFFRSFNFEKPGLNEAVSRYGGDVMTLGAMGKVFPHCCPNDLPNL